MRKRLPDVSPYSTIEVVAVSVVKIMTALELVTRFTVGPRVMDGFGGGGSVAVTDPIGAHNAHAITRTKTTAYCRYPEERIERLG